MYWRLIAYTLALLSLSTGTAAIMADTCLVCVQGCTKTPEGGCPKNWMIPAGSAESLCSEAWNCMQYPNTIQRVVGVMFLLVALIYVIIIYHRHRHASEDSRARTATSSERITCSMSPSGIFIYIYKIIMVFIQRVPPQNFARSVDRTLRIPRSSPFC